MSAPSLVAKSHQRCRQQRLVIITPVCASSDELGYQLCCWIVLNDEPELLAGGFKRS